MMQPLDLDLTSCDREPIHIPGTVQGYGVLFALEPGSTVVAAVSENVETLLGHSVEDVLGHALGEFEPELDAAAAARPDAPGPEPSAFRVTLPVAGARQHFSGAIHSNGPYTILELERADALPQWRESSPVLFETRGAFARMSTARSVRELCDRLAEELRRVTGYDRTMVYRFLEDESGEVLSEVRSPELEPYLGHRYPATDIPTQARRLYLSQSIRYIADVDGPQAALVPRLMPGTGLPLDLSAAALRSPSPVHLEYLRNMGVGSSVVMSLVNDGRLWGMLVAHNSVAMRCPRTTRTVCDFLGMLGSSLLAGTAELELLKARESSRDAEDTLVARLARAGDITEALAGGHITLADAIASDGFALGQPDGTIRTFGETPSAGQIEAIVREIETAGRREIASSDSLVRTWPALASLDLQPSCGILFAPALEGGNKYIAWFRNEKIRSIKWAGDPNKPAVSGPEGRLRPRNSFALWREDVRGRSEPWSEADREAAGVIREHLAAAHLRLAQAQLALLASHDALTGLANRRAVLTEIDRLALADKGCAALIYIDLDRFKAINDDLGHEAGDEVLVAVADRLSSLVRPGDVVARFGGDEFVVICHACPPPAAARLAVRIVKAFEAPLRLRGGEVAETVSVGWAIAKSSEEAHELIHRADVAMYDAKRHGGNQAAPSAESRRRRRGHDDPPSPLDSADDD
jgi:diguanylate cyclase (GGDEF)-like protein